MPARAIQGVAFESLQDLRSQLAPKGLLTQDMPSCPTWRTWPSRRGVLTLAEQTVDALLQEQTRQRMIDGAARACWSAATAGSPRRPG